MPKAPVIVISSLVARGAVGGRASVFALERLGFPVVFVPTVVLPWHPGHGRAARMTPEAATFTRLIDDIAGAGWLGEVGAVLTGYFGDPDQVGVAAALVAAVKAANPAALHLCDPIIGDAGGLFQPEAIAVAIRDTLLPRADMATPNRFELGWLSRRSLGDLADVRQAATALGPAEVVVTSASSDAANKRVDTVVVDPSGAACVSHRWASDSTVHGTGDLFAALYLAHRLDGAPPKGAAARAASTVLAMVAAAEAEGLDELPLARHQTAIVTPPPGVTIETLG